MRRIAAVVVLVLAWPAAAGALAQAPGAPTQTGCLASAPPPAGCTGSDLLTGVGNPAYSPDGAQLYVPATTPGTLTIFRRDASGWISGECYSATALAGCSTIAALDGAFDATVSPDGRNLYVTTREHPAAKADGVVEFARAADGRLAFLGCINESGSPNCTQLAPLDNAGAIAVSPDGTSVYVAAQTSEAVVAFDRGPAGTLTFRNCVANTPGTAGCATSNGRFSTPSDLAVSPDGRQVYVSDYNTPYRVVQLDRAANGSLSAPASAPCIAQPGTAGCTTFEVVREGTSLAMSADGRFLYVTTRYPFGGEAVVLIARDPVTGAMSLPAGGCWETPGRSDPGCTPARGMEGPGSIALTPNGLHAYVASIDDRGVLTFDRDGATGMLAQHANPFGCLVSPSPADPGADGCGPLQGPARALFSAVAPSGAELVTTGTVSDFGSGRLWTFALTPDPTPVPTPAATPQPTPTAAPVSPAAKPELPAPVPPVAGRSARADLVSGQVLVTLPGGVTAPLTDAASIPVGATVDARAGALTLRSAVAAKGSRTQTATVSAGIFALRQRRARARQKVSTDLVLVSPAGAEARCARRTGARPPKGVVRGLSVAAKGVFRTVGGAATAAAKGRASWTATDRCDGTVTKVRKGRVAVLAKGRHRPTVVGAGRTFIVRARLFAARRRP